MFINYKHKTYAPVGERSGEGRCQSAAANYGSPDMKSSAKTMLGVTLRQLPARQYQIKT